MNARVVGERVAALRKEKGLTQKQLAELINVTDKAISKWEQGKNFPDLMTLEPLAAALGSTPAALLGLEERSSDEALSASAALYEEERAQWLKELRRHAWWNLIMNVLFFIGLVLLSRYLDEAAYDGYPMSLTGLMNGLSGTLIGYAIWTLRSVQKQLKAQEKPLSVPDR